MAYDEQLANRIRDAFRGIRDVAECKMFGGLAFMYRNRMCCGIVGNDLVVRVSDDEVAAAMRLRHVRPMDFTGRPLKGFLYVAPPGFRSGAALRSWLARGRRFVQQKAKRARKVRTRTRRQS